MRLVFYDSSCGSLGVQYLLAGLKARGHDVSLYLDPSASRDYIAQDLAFKRWLSLAPRQVSNDLVALRPDVVCFSLNSYYYTRLLEIIRLVKQTDPRILVICGGMHVTLVPEVVLQNKEIDFALLGEGDISLPSLLEALEESGVERVKALSDTILPGVWNVHDGGIVRRGLSPIIEDLDSVPFPDKDLLYQANPALASIYSTMASRGCLYKCSYCNSATVHALYACHGVNFFRVRSVSNVIEELRQAKSKYPARYVEFFDDTFGVGRPWLNEFCERYKAEVGLPFGIEVSPLVLDEEKIDRLADSGCVTLELGIQSANPVVRRELLNRHETNERVIRLVRYGVERGILVELDIIVNLPGETREHVVEALDLVCEARPHMVNLSYLQYLPKTQIIDTALAQGILTPEEVQSIEMGERPKPHRFLPKSDLADYYKTLPFEMFIAARLPTPTAKRLMRLIEKPVLRRPVSFFVTVFLYASRLFLAYRDTRNYFLRWNIRRFAYSIRRVFGRKLLGRKCHASQST